MDLQEYNEAQEKIDRRLALLVKETKLRRLDFNEAELLQRNELMAKVAESESRERLDFFLVEYLAHEVHRRQDAPRSMPLNGELMPHFERVSRNLDEHIEPGPADTGKRREILEKILTHAGRAAGEENEDLYAEIRQDLNDLNPENSVARYRLAREVGGALHKYQKFHPGAEYPYSGECDHYFTDESARRAVDAFENVQNKVGKAVTQLDSLYINHGLDDITNFRRNSAARGREIVRINSLVAEEPQERALKRFARLQEERQQRHAGEVSDDSFFSDSADDPGRSRKRARETLSDEERSVERPPNPAQRRRLDEAGASATELDDRPRSTGRGL